MMKRYVQGFVLIVLSSAFALLAVEGIVQLYIYKVAHQGKIFQPDARLGWKPMAGLDLQRLNADGEIWTINTDEKGMRGPSAWDPAAQTRVLVAGDSFAFGEGIDIEKRFDSRIEKDIPGVSIVNVGGAGYGADQQLIAARPYLRSLRGGDVLIILTYQNDFYDILRKSHSGRAKPWFELRAGNALEEHGPDISWTEILRDKSYIFARISALLERQREFTQADIEYAAALYARIVRSETEDALKRGVKVLLAFHGIEDIQDADSRRAIEESLQNVCAFSGFACLSLERNLKAHQRGRIFLRDGHWTEFGHAVVAEAIAKLLRTATFLDEHHKQRRL